MSINVQPITPATTTTATSSTTTTIATTPYYPTTTTPSSDGSISSCSDNSSFSVISGFSTATTISNTSSRSICNPSKLSPNIIKNFKLTSLTNILPTTTTTTTTIPADAAAYKKNLKITIPTSAEMTFPSPPGHSPSPKISYLGKRRHSADGVMAPSLPPSRRGIVNSGDSVKPEKLTRSPPLTALHFDFSNDSFRRDASGRVHIEVVPTPSVAADDMMELYASETEEDKQLKEMGEGRKEEDEDEEADGIDSDFDRYSAAGSPLYELGEPVKPYKVHPSHPYYSLEKQLMCKICHNLMLDPHGLSCGHAFCGICLALWIDGAKTKCYECDAHIIPTQRSMFPNFKLDSTVELVAGMILDESELEVRSARKIEWLQYSYSRMPGLRPYSALLREQYAMLLRGIQDASVDSPPKAKSTSTDCACPADAPVIHGPAVRSKPIPIPKGTPRST